jgi:transcriptional regulator with XRE-family HTH domain
VDTGQDEIKLLRELKDLYGAKYILKYFGFSFKGIAESLGISPGHLSKIVCGKAKLTIDNGIKLEQIFRHMDIEGRVKGFKETELDLMGKRLRRDIRENNT